MVFRQNFGFGLTISNWDLVNMGCGGRKGLHGSIARQATHGEGGGLYRGWNNNWACVRMGEEWKGFIWVCWAVQ